ncbi:MAG: hypothetical protein ACRCYU_10455 [Nocardioides sp.]
MRRRCSTIVLLASIGSTLVAGCTGDEKLSPSPSGTTGEALPALIVAPPSDGVLDALVTGTLAINSSNCFVLNGRVLIAPAGSRVLEAGQGIEVPRLGEIAVGEIIETGGGYLDTLTDPDIRGAADACDGGSTGQVRVAITPSG